MQDVRGITVDDESTRDIDDAFWIEREDDGWRLTVSIADVAGGVPRGGPNDEEARSRIATDYFANGNRPMLPRHLSEGALSLWPQQKRAVLTVSMRLGNDLSLQSTEIAHRTLISEAKLSYDAIPIIKTASANPFHTLINNGLGVAMGLLQKRRDAGALVLYDLHKGWVSTEEGAIRRLERRTDTVGYILIQELMILTNRAVAEWAIRRDVPVLFRNHTAHSASPDRFDLIREIEEGMRGEPKDIELLRQRTNMLLDRARYEPAVRGHYGLNLGAYVHFTSPIRRFADLVTERQIRAAISGEALPYTRAELEEIARHINDTLERTRASKSEQMKKRDEKRALQSVARGVLARVTPVEFERATKMEVRSGEAPSEGFQDGYLERLAAGKVTVVAMVILLAQPELGDEWKPLRQATADFLGQKPEDAVSVLSAAMNIAGWANVVYHVIQDGPPHLRRFYVSADLACGDCVVGDDNPRHIQAAHTDPTRVGHACAMNLKLAKQLAAVSLLANRLGLRTPKEVEQPARIATLPAPAEDTPAAPPPPTKDDLGAVDNAVSALFENAQTRKIAPPKFAFKMTGPKHLPLIDCRCTFDGIERSATGSSKQTAKKLAAESVLLALCTSDSLRA